MVYELHAVIISRNIPIGEAIKLSKEFISENRERIVPTSLALLECFLTN